MANSIKKYVWDATHSTNSQFLAPTALSGRESTDIKVKVGKAELTNSQYQLVTSGASRYAKFNQGFTPNVGDPIRIYRQTNHTGRLVDFVDGSLLTSETLDLDSNQLFNIAQEAYDKGDETTIGSESFYYTQGDAPENVAVGTLWYDTGSSTNTLQVWSGTEWQQTAPAKVKKTYQRVTTNGFLQVANNAHSAGKTKFTDTAFKAHSSLYLNGVKLVEASTLANIPSKGDYFLSGGDVILLNLSSDTDVLVSETFDGSFSSSVTASEANAEVAAQASEAYAGLANDKYVLAATAKSDAEDAKDDAAKYASHPKDSTFSTHDNSATNQYSAKHYAETAADSATTASSAANNAQVQTVGTDLALGSNSKIKKVADDIDAVGDVSGIIDDVTSVSNLGNELDTIVNKYDGTTNASGTNKNIVQIDTVADNIGDVNTVAADTSKIDTIASDLDTGASSFIKKVSDGMASVTTVAGYVGTALANGITWLANTTNQNTLGAVEGKIAEIDAVEAKLTQIDAVAGVADEVAVVGESGYKGNVQTVANTDYKAKVTTVASMQDDVNTVASASSDIDTITTGDNLTSVVAVATDLNGSNNIGTVAGIPTQVETVAGIAAEVVTVHGNNADISTVATSLNAGNSIDDVSGGITNVETVAGAISEVQTVAGISSDVTNLSASTGNMATLVSKLDQTNDLAGAVTDAQNSATSASSSASTASTHATTASGHASTAATHAANLGSVAYQNLTAIAESKAVTAKDVFVYDTSKDSDGGAWRNRTQGTSWYNEALNTSSRGATKKFPAVAVIVTESYKTTIYDADDPSMPMWMVFETGSGGFLYGTPHAVTMKDGMLVVGTSSQACGECRFVSDEYFFRNSNGTKWNTNDILNRNLGGGPYNTGTVERILAGVVNDIAMTVLPNAPIDPETGLPVPTIAVATDGGVSVIKDDGSVVSGSEVNPSWAVRLIEFDKYNNIWASIGNNASFGHVRLLAKAPYDTVGDIGVQTATNEGFNRGNPAVVTDMDKDPDNHVYLLDGGMRDLAATPNGITVAQTDGLSQTLYNRGDIRKSLANHITSSYNTGWMNGDIKLATLMDTTAETISAPELVTNGDFSSFGSNLVSSTTQSGTIPYQGSPWRSHSGSGQFSISNNVITVNASIFEAIRYDITTSNNKAYKITFDLTRTSGDVTVYTHGGAPDFTIANINTSGTHTVYYTNDGTQPATALQFATSNLVGTLSNFKVEEITGWEAIDGNPNVSIDNGRLKMVTNATDGWQAVYNYFSTEVGKTYAVTATVESASGNVGEAHFRGSAGNTVSIHNTNMFHRAIPSGQSQTFTLYFTATNVRTNVHLMTQINNTVYLDNVSVVEVVADRSINANPLNIVGNVTKSAVATGAELVGYSGFSSSNRLVQSYNSDLDFGTGDFSIMAWVKTKSAPSQYILDRSNKTNNTNRLNFLIGGTNSNLFCRIGVTTVTTSFSFAVGSWYCVALCRQNGVLRFYVNGNLIGTGANTQSNTGNYDTTIAGYNAAGGQGAAGTSLLRISATAPTAEQIAKIYRDEKPLFQENAKATLYGSSDAVTALAYDDDTELLHAGTSAGRSVFKGLQRVSNTTDAIGTAISASNDLVVEE